jgi:peptidoglycan hydrolase CwlO-like protein
MRKLWLLLAVSLAVAPGCVTSGTHKKKLAALKQTHEEEAAAAQKRESELTKQLGDLTKEHDTLKIDSAAQQKQVDLLTATNGQMEERLKQLGQDVPS